MMGASILEVRRGPWKQKGQTNYQDHSFNFILKNLLELLSCLLHFERPVLLCPPEWPTPSWPSWPPRGRRTTHPETDFAWHPASLL